jgi:SAM-dependent methyltransferase
MHQAGVRIRGLELSATMLKRAKEKAPAIAWSNGRAEAIPFASGSFDGATCTFVHHHMAEPLAAFMEVHRVLTPHARFVILNGKAEQMRHYWLNEYFPGLMARAIAPYERFDAVELLETAGFRIACEEKYDVTPDLKDLFLCCGKLYPERYLDPHIRSGISFFADALDQEEVARGLQRIADDIESGRINDVIAKYAWDGGDYMFTVAER